MRFPRQRRITSRGEFQRVRKEGKSYRGQFIVLGYLYDPDAVTAQLKVGYITTRRIGNAVMRNRVRRRMRGVLQRTGDRILPGHLLVIIARNPAASATSEQLEKEWKWLLHRTSLIKEEATEV